MTHTHPGSGVSHSPKTFTSARGAPRILLVDDHALDVELACLALASCAPHAEVTFVLDAEEALMFLRRSDVCLPDLVLIDVNMPGLGGFEVLGRLRSDARTRSLPVVMCSTSDDPRDVAAAQALGVRGYLVKPMQLEDLERALAAALASVLKHEPRVQFS